MNETRRKIEKKLTKWPKRRVLRRLGPFSSSPPPPFLLSVMIKTYINNTLVSIEFTRRIKKKLTSVAQTMPDASFGPAACRGVVVCDGGCCCVVVGCHGLSTLALVVGCRCCRCRYQCRVFKLRFKLVLLMLFVVDKRARSRDFIYN